MKRHMRKILIVFLILLIIALFMYTFSVLSQEKISELTKSLGKWGPVLLIIYFVFSQVFAPVSGFPGWLAAFALYEIWAFVYLYISYIFGATINFYIGKKLGRKWVGKLGGKKTLKHIDDVLMHKEREMLIFGRLIGFPLFDVVSYAAGFTRLSFKEYALISLVCTAIPFVIMAFLFNQMDLTTTSMMALSFTIVIVGSGATIALHRWNLRK